MAYGKYNRDIPSLNPLISGGHEISADIITPGGEVLNETLTIIARLETTLIHMEATQEEHTETLHRLETTQDSHTETLHHLNTTQDEHTDTLHHLETTQDSHTETLHHLEATQDQYTDVLDRQSKRLDGLEEVLAKTLVERVEGEDIKQQINSA